jgi:putative transposase
MPRGKPEQAEHIIPKLREVEVELGRGKTVAEAVKKIGVTEGLKVPKKQPQRRRLWLNDGSCIRLRPTHRNHVWSYDFVMDRTSDGRPIRMLTIVDEHTRECLAIDVAKKLTSEDVLERLGRVGVKTLYIEPGSPWRNGYVESFNGKLRDALLKRESFDTLLEAKVLIERLRQVYNTVRPHRAGLIEGENLP